MHLADSTKSDFHVVRKDPMQVHQCKLANGLTLFLSVHKDEPRIATEIAVRAGSKHDPATSTGLAHYFEHMMFKGTDQMGTLDWEAEKKLLDQIEALYEAHRNTSDAAEKRRIYLEIDRVSAEAAKIATANEYDKLLGAMGAKGTNAYTWVEQTVYLNDIPSNELERWFKVEAERFRRPVLRLFHTELETVFEEFNISQDKDFRKVSKAMMETLMPSHPYGTQTTLGKGEDLKNPSQKAIYNFFDQHYVPNNMAITLCGDFDLQEVKKLAEQYFGSYETKKVPPFKFEPQPDFTERQERTVYGEENEWIELGWRLPGPAHADHNALNMLSMVLYNEVAGLIDTHLVQAQKLLASYAYLRTHEDYSMLIIYGKPREGQSLAEVESLLIEQVQKLHDVQFDAWLLEGITKMLKVEEQKRLESNNSRASAITTMYVLGRPWADMVRFVEKMSAISPAEIMRVAQKWVRTNNYVAVKKLHGKDSQVIKVEKPPITPIEVNRDELSKFAQQILANEAPPLQPQFPNFKEIIHTTSLQKGIKLHVVTDPSEKLTKLEWIFPAGKLYNKQLSMLQSYLGYLGTSKLSLYQFKQELYKQGMQMEISVTDQKTIVRLSGLAESLSAAIATIVHFFQDVQPNHAALENLKADVLKRRQNNKMSKDFILRNGLKPFAMHGNEAIERSVIPEAELKAITSADLLNLFKELTAMQHELHYYGPFKPAKAKKVIKSVWAPSQPLTPKPKVVKFRELDTRKNKVLFVHFPMVQVEMLQISKGTQNLNKEEYLMERWFNNYFGTSMSSVVFQEIREARAMAYQTYAMTQSPGYKDKAHYFFTFVGTQPDKMAEAISVMNHLVEDMPVNTELIEQARQNTIKVLNANRLSRKNAYWRRESIQAAGWKEEPLKEVLDFTKTADQKSLEEFHQKYIKGRKSTWVIMGDRDRLDMKALRKIGQVQELTIEQVLGY
jgi:predicted Zn-dependent peptidase